MQDLRDNTYFSQNEDWKKLSAQCEMVRKLADKYGTGLVDVYELYRQKIKEPADLVNLLSHVNHPSSEGHAMIAKGIARESMSETGSYDRYYENQPGICFLRSNRQRTMNSVIASNV